MVTILAWTEQVKLRGISEQPNDIRVAAKQCNKNMNGKKTWINRNHKSSIALELSVVDKGGGT